MFLKHWLLASILSAICMLFLCRLSSAEDAFSYFKEPEINFWRERTDTPRVGSAQSNIAPISNSSKSGFEWKKYLDPKHDEFFKEGDYTPPAPFMEIARNPSDENIQNWFKYLELKNGLLKRLQARLEEVGTQKGAQITIPAGAIKDPAIAASLKSASFSSEEIREAIRKRTAVPNETPPQAKDYRLRLYFDSHCPHCQHMIETVSQLLRSGYYVELKQIDSDLGIRSKLPFPVTDASKEELSRYKIESVPVLLIGNLKKGTVSRVDGYQTAQTVVEAMSKIQ